jgi:hypothetical protein
MNQPDQLHFSVNDRIDNIDVWVQVEKYLHGTVIDMGGKNKPNVHVALQDGTNITVSATQNLLKSDTENRIYREIVIHVTAEENLVTGELKNYQLLEFVNYQPSYDATEFNLMVEKGTKAWADVLNTNTWLESLRGIVLRNGFDSSQLRFDGQKDIQDIIT